MKITPSIAVAFLGTALSLPGGRAGAADDEAVHLFVKDYVASLVGTNGLAETRYSFALVDLNGDGRDEAVVYLVGPTWCGSGGCDALVLTPKDGSYEAVMDATVTQLPIGVLETKSHGWRDLTVGVGGGGMPAGVVVMRFDGTAYPDNPTAPPAEPLTGAAGTVLIPETDEGHGF